MRGLRKAWPLREIYFFSSDEHNSIWFICICYFKQHPPAHLLESIFLTSITTTHYCSLLPVGASAPAPLAFLPPADLTAPVCGSSPASQCKHEPFTFTLQSWASQGPFQDFTTIHIQESFTRCPGCSGPDLNSCAKTSPFLDFTHLKWAWSSMSISSY